MGGMKKGSGDLSFEDDSEGNEETDAKSQSGEAPTATPEQDADTTSTGSSDSDNTGSVTDASSETESDSAEESPTYPYFVRRSNVGDERDTRLEIHVRDDVADTETEFLNNLAEELGTTDVAKTDAREYALVLAHERPELVAELMQEDGYGELD